jgi:putative ATP-dependent endonuclease of the OLD family
VFVTTHSTNFVDSVSFQNIYLVSKGYDQKTSAKSLDSGEGALQIPAELGLRLSTVFMFDRLVFVEGPSDEAVLRELCKTLGLDLASRNVGFVQMGGVRNFAHFAARSTLDLLSRRQVGMWFVADRDERDDADVDRMLKILGDKAKLHVWERRELENYLMCPSAVLALIQQKTASTKTESSFQGTSEEVATALASEAAALKSEVVRLRMHKKLLGPIHLTGQSIDGPIEARLQSAIERLQERVDAIESTRTQVEADIEKDWSNVALARAPGTTLLENVMRKFGFAFSKEGGDSARLARLIRKDSIPTEIAQLLIEIATS